MNSNVLAFLRHVIKEKIHLALEGQIFHYLTQLEQGVFFSPEALKEWEGWRKKVQKRSTCVVPTIIYRTIQVHDDGLKTMLRLY